jgi:hypothetical protein
VIPSLVGAAGHGPTEVLGAIAAGAATSPSADPGATGATDSAGTGSTAAGTERKPLPA